MAARKPKPPKYRCPIFRGGELTWGWVDLMDLPATICPPDRDKYLPIIEWADQVRPPRS